jgi:hypothetical protein
MRGPTRQVAMAVTDDLRSITRAFQLTRSLQAALPTRGEVLHVMALTGWIDISDSWASIGEAVDIASVRRGRRGLTGHTQRGSRGPRSSAMAGEPLIRA